MLWVTAIRVIGVIAGVTLLGLGTVWLLLGLAEPPSQHRGAFLLFGVSLLVPGALFALPWSRIRSYTVWCVLFVSFVLVVPPAATFILAVNTWSGIHGGGDPGFTLGGVLLGAWASQIPAIWSLRPTRKAEV